MNTLTVIISLIIVLFVYIGYRRGLIRSILKTMLTALSLLLAYFLTPFVSEAVCKNTKIDDFFEKKINTRVEETIGDEVNTLYKDLINNLPIGAGDEGLDESQKEWVTELAMQVELNDEQQEYFIDSMNIPKFVKDNLKEGNTNENKEQLGANNFYKYISKYMARMIVNAMVYLMLSVVLFILIHILGFALTVAVRIPVVNGINKSGGLIFGAIEALILVWGFFLIVAVTINTDMGNNLYNQIEESSFLSLLYDSNVFIPLITKM